MSRHEYENDHDDDLYDQDDHDDHYENDDHHTNTSTSISGYIHTENVSDDHYNTATSTNTLNDNYTHGYQFAIANGAVTGITEIEHGYAQQERVEYGETWTVNGNQVVKTEIEHGFTQTSVYADTNGDGIFTKISQTYSSSTVSAVTNPIALNSIQGGNDTDDQWSGGTSDDHYYGGVGDDSLNGAYGDDDLFGGNGDDDLYGDDGDDHIYGSNGNDHIYGGIGTDEAYFTGSYRDHFLTQNGSGLIISDNHLERDGTDYLEGVELLHFSDVTTIANYNNIGVYRFYNADTGSHFYTGDLAEAENVLTTLQSFQYEGMSFTENTSAANAVDVYRFYNTETGTHFFTSSETEVQHIQANLHNYNYEGVAYQAYGESGVGTTALYRFFNTETGTHFYTANQTEMEAVKVELAGTYNYEGVAYYVGQ